MSSPSKPPAAADSENPEDVPPGRLYSQSILLSGHPRKFLAGIHLYGFSIHDHGVDEIRRTRKIPITIGKLQG